MTYNTPSIQQLYNLGSTASQNSVVVAVFMLFEHKIKYMNLILIGCLSFNICRNVGMLAVGEQQLLMTFFKRITVPTI